MFISWEILQVTADTFTYGPDAVAVSISCSGPGNTTLAHELGHYFSLPHPFDNINSIKEYVDGSNCSVGGDLFCDTRADILDYRWPCPYNGGETDPHGDTYDPDETLFMSYSLDECQSRFTTEQSDAMINMLMFDRAALLNHPAPNTSVIADGAQLVNPVEGTIDVPHDWVEFKWNAVPNATFYHLQATKYFSFSAPLAVNMIVNGTALTTYLEKDENYMWRVKPLSSGYTCAEFSEEGHFTTVLGTGIHDAANAASELKIYPSLVNAGNSCFISFESALAGVATVELISVNGQVANRFSVPVSQGSNMVPVNTAGLAPGLYLVHFDTGSQLLRAKVVVAE
jgi:hypothetical protein